jgi:hypothetical protein
MDEETRNRLNAIEDKIRILEIEVRLLNQKLDLQESGKITTGQHGIHQIMIDQFNAK